MESLTKIIARLRASEIQFIKHFYRYGGSKNFGKRRLLFEGIVSGRFKTKEQAMSKLFDKPSASAFSQLKSKCKQEIIELLILHDGTVKSNLKSDRDRFEVVHGLSKLMVLNDRGLIEEAHANGERLKKLAVDSENFSEAALICKEMHNPLHKYTQPEQFEQEQVEVLQLREASNESFMAQYQWSKGVLPPSDYLRRTPALNAVGQEALPDLQRKLSSIKSNKMSWHYNLLAAEYTLHSNKVDLCRGHVAELLVLLDASESVSDDLVIYLNSLRFRLGLLDGDEQEIEGQAAKIVSLFEASNGAAVDALEQCYFSARHASYCPQASLLCDAVIAHEALQCCPSVKVRWNLYKAACQFDLEKFAESSRTLNQMTVGYNAISGGSIAAGMLEIMCMIERQQYDRLEYRIQAYFKMIRRKSRDDFDNNFERVKLIEGIVQQLLKHSFDFRKAMPSISDALQLLQSQTGEYAWKKYSLELVPFHYWINQRLIAVGVEQLA